MEREFKRIYECMVSSNKILDGEYYVIHADHLHDFLMAIEHYFEEDKKIEKLNKKHFHKKQRQLANKINEIIDKINRMENE